MTNMLPFFNLFEVLKRHIGTLLIIICMLLLASLQVYVIYEICSNTRKESKNILHNTILTNIAQINRTKSKSAPLAFFAYNQRENTVTIGKEQTADTTIYLNGKIDIRLVDTKGTYDARDTSLWSLAKLGELLISTSKKQAFTPPFSLLLTDKDGKTLETYESEMSSFPAWSYQFEIPLGFLEHHQLSAKFVYPIVQLWNETWVELITTLVLSLLLIICISSLSEKLRKEKKMRKFSKEFTSSLIHNLRSPLYFLRHQLSLIVGLSSSPKEQNDIIDKCKDQTIDILGEIDSLLSLSVEYRELYLEHVDLSATIDKIINQYQEVCAEKHVTITVDDQITKRVYIDANQVGAALGNLIDNAIKYSHLVPCIDIKCWIDNKQMVISVKDNGIGIPKSDQKNIFNENYRVTYNEDGLTHKGYGIGLHYVKSVALAHKGKVRVESDGKTGTTFTIYIPQNGKMI